jgi:hypothetical protein
MSQILIDIDPQFVVKNLLSGRENQNQIMARLVVNPGSPVAWEIQLKPGENSIGRGSANDYTIADPSVSGCHCQIVVENGGTVIKDLGSTNGTYINRTPVQEAALQHGQTIHLGGVELLFYTDAPASAASPAGGLGATPPPVPLPAFAPLGRPEPLDMAAPGGPPGNMEMSPLAPSTPIGSETRVAPPPSLVAPRPVPSLRPTVSVIASRPAATASAPVASPPIPRPLPPAAAGAAFVAGPHNCKFHPKTPGRFFCNKCHLYFCELCVTVREAGGAQGKFCRQCGSACVPVQVQAARPTASKGFFALMPGAFAYPFRGSGPLLLILATIVLSSLQFISAGLLAIFTKTVALGYLFVFMQNIIHATANEEEEMPGLPGLDGVFGACFRFLGCILISFGAALVLLYFAVVQEEPMAAVAILPAMVFGCIYFPMALLAVAMKNSVMAANPLVVIPAIFKVPLEYLVAIILLGAVFGVRLLGEMLIRVIFGRNAALTNSMSELFAMFGARMFWALAGVYLLTVNMRILGLLYLTKKQRLGWFSH